MYKDSKIGFKVERNFLSEKDREKLIEEITSSEYLVRNVREMWVKEQNLYGDAFSIIFKKEFIGEVYEKFPSLETFFSKIIYDHCNIFYFCAMSLSEACYIPKHFDGDLLDSYNLLSGKEVNIPCPVDLPMPFCSDVYYAHIPESMEGGTLKVYGLPPSDVDIIPESNMLVEFGEYEHEVSEINNSSGEKRLSLVLLQNKYLNFQREFFPDCLFSKG
ncbi:MAG: hypothetical protein CL512_05880 [Actinobacteria bacterium]|nr:hypothetical protein [Actinomycetota bacterium]